MTPKPALLDPAAVPSAGAPLDSLKALLATPDLASKRWIWEQYDHMVMGDTVVRPGGDAAVVRIHDSVRGLAMTADCTPRYCVADPEEGGKQAVAEAWRNLIAVGALPLAITDNMNFGNPEKPEIMGQFAGCIEGIAAACVALDFPVVSGNVSLYNETNGNAILPTPMIGAVGRIDDLDQFATVAFRKAGESIVLIGDTKGHLGRSIYLRDLLGREEGAPPPVDLAAERRNGDFVRGLIESGTIVTCHDIADGGLLVAVAEMALASGIGAEVTPPASLPCPLHAWLFGEDQGRYLVVTGFADDVLAQAKAAGVPAIVLGRTGGAALTVTGSDTISLAEIRNAHEGWLPGYMAAPDAL